MSEINLHDLEDALHQAEFKRALAAALLIGAENDLAVADRELLAARKALFAAQTQQPSEGEVRHD